MILIARLNDRGQLVIPKFDHIEPKGRSKLFTMALEAIELAHSLGAPNVEIEEKTSTKRLRMKFDLQGKRGAR